MFLLSDQNGGLAIPDTVEDVDGSVDTPSDDAEMALPLPAKSGGGGVKFGWITGVLVSCPK